MGSGESKMLQRMIEPLYLNNSLNNNDERNTKKVKFRDQENEEMTTAERLHLPSFKEKLMGSKKEATRMELE
ncbi:hypothetical protein K2173_023271 [Erythroxylum novogranatense]|uniref:Uncharacterized protein n=1 Tax=Erythroxylum novogranatense TaxID=1862640 RepID=A0AAV8T9V1_9ROSI|nr:hypothetical protein K2173_023271 [Erythroxylum novogranatense]